MGKHLSLIEVLFNQRTDIVSQLLVTNGRNIIESLLKCDKFFTTQIDMTIVSLLVHWFPNGPQLTSLLLHKPLFTILIIVLITIGRLIDNSYVVFKADHHISQCIIGILRECFPRLANNSVLVAQLTTQIFPLFRIIGRLIIQIVDDVTRGTSNYKGVHRMMAVIYTLFPKTTLQFQGHRSLEHPLSFFIFPMSESLRPGKSVESLKA